MFKCIFTWQCHTYATNSYDTFCGKIKFHCLFELTQLVSYHWFLFSCLMLNSTFQHSKLKSRYISLECFLLWGIELIVTSYLIFTCFVKKMTVSLRIVLSSTADAIWCKQQKIWLTTLLRLYLFLSIQLLPIQKYQVFVSNDLESQWKLSAL